MRLLRHVEACNSHDPSGFLPFRVNGRDVGMLRPAMARAVLETGAPPGGHAAFRALPGGGVDFVGGGSADLTTAMAGTLAMMEQAGTIPTRRGELYAAVTGWGQAPLFLIDRVAASLFGLRCFGVHLNGYVRRRDGIHLWVGRRAGNRGIAAGKLDNMVAGGQPAGLSLEENLAKEAYEEAGLLPAQIEAARAVGSLRYTMDTPTGVRRDTLFCYDLEMPADLEPRNTDGEVAGFELWPAHTVLESLRGADDWKFNVSLVVLDFLLRHHVLGADDPEYRQLMAALRPAAPAHRAPQAAGLPAVAQNRSSIAL